MEMISDREHILLAVIDRLRIIRATDAAWLAGYTDYTYCRKCLRKLCDMGLLQICRDSAGSNCYYLSGRGLAVLGKQTSHTYEVSATTHHALVVGRVCAWLRRTEGASPGELLTDSVLRSKGDKQRHRPDIVFRGHAYEIELNHKPLSLLEKNIRDNNSYQQQVWVTPDNRLSIARNLNNCAQRVGVRIQTIPLAEIEKQVATADIHKNKRDTGTWDEIESVVSMPATHSMSKYTSYFKK